MSVTVIGTLKEKHCKPCEGGTPAIQGQHLHELLSQLKDWQLVEDRKIVKTFKFADFITALAFTNLVGQLAQSENHHPDIHLGWGKVTVELSTHAVKGLSENDFILAARIDDLPR